MSNIIKEKYSDEWEQNGCKYDPGISGKEKGTSITAEKFGNKRLL